MQTTLAEIKLTCWKLDLFGDIQIKIRLKTFEWSAGLFDQRLCNALYETAESDNESLRYEQILAPSSTEWTQICFLWAWRKEIRMFSQRVFFSQVCHEGLLNGKMNQTDYFDRISNDWMTSFKWSRKWVWTLKGT